MNGMNNVKQLGPLVDIGRLRREGSGLRVGACAWEFLLACPYGVENMLQHFERFDWHLIGPVYCIYGQKRRIWRGVPGKTVKGCIA